MEHQRSGGTRLVGRAVRRCLLGSALVFATPAGERHAFAQSPPSESEQFQANIQEVARSLQNNPRLKRLSQEKRENVVQFVAGNMLFTMVHELGHAVIHEMGISVLGREEDAADDFAVLRLLNVGTQVSHRVLVESAKGWFLSDRRDRHEGEKLVFYDEHGLDKQRAYQIVCLMVGSDPVKFRDLANETKLPQDRQDTCQAVDYPDVSKSWEMALKPHHRTAEQPKTKLEVVYGDGKGDLSVFAQGFRSLRLLELVGERASDQLAWPAPFSLEVQSCGDINARWVSATRKLTLCYELAQDFAELYRDYNVEPAAANRKRKSK